MNKKIEQEIIPLKTKDFVLLSKILKDFIPEKKLENLTFFLEVFKFSL